MDVSFLKHLCYNPIKYRKHDPILLLLNNLYPITIYLLS